MPRALVISDTHARAADVPQVMECLEPYLGNIDAILHAGDVTCAELLAALEMHAPLEAVAGNMDPPEVAAQLPEQRVVDMGGKRIGMMHGWGASGDLTRKIYERFTDASGQPQVDAIVFGHSHRPLKEFRNGVLLLNPGSVTQRRSNPFCSLALLDAGRHLDAEIIRL